MRLDGQPISQVAAATGLSAPTIIALHRAYAAGGWAAVESRTPGRPKKTDVPPEEASLRQQATTQKPEDLGVNAKLWSAQALASWLSQTTGTPVNERSALRRIKEWKLNPPDLLAEHAAQAHWPTPAYTAFCEQARQGGLQVVWAGDHGVDGEASILFARNLKGQLHWLPAHLPLTDDQYVDFFTRLLVRYPKGVAVVLNFAGLRFTPRLNALLAAKPQQLRLFVDANEQPTIQSAPGARPSPATPSSGASTMSLTHLQRLEAESIEIMREAVAEAQNPVMLYSIGKDSAVMLRLALKAFYPGKLPFPLLHVDTKWKFRDMYAFREQMAKEHGFDLLVHVNPDGEAQGINPFTHGSAIHTDVMKTAGLRQALEKYKFDLAFGGARRDEEKSRAKERIFSFRSAQHRWDPKAQRPELWNIYNARKHQGESIRVFPLSNWTELDIWQYIHLEDIPIVPLYFSKPRPVVERDGTLIMVDDERMPLREGEVPQMKSVRFRTLGCYPLTGAVESKATTLTDIIQEMLLTTTSERQGRVIDHDSAGSMEKKKQEGYF